MCGPAVAWDWLILDLSYILVLVGGAAVLRARGVGIVTLVWFGVLATAVGGFLFAATYSFQTGAAVGAPAATAFTAIVAC